MSLGCVVNACACATPQGLNAGSCPLLAFSLWRLRKNWRFESASVEKLSVNPYNNKCFIQTPAAALICIDCAISMIVALSFSIVLSWRFCTIVQLRNAQYIVEFVLIVIWPMTLQICMQLD